MRFIGVAERVLDLLLVEHGIGREAFGKPIIYHSKNMETVSRARIRCGATSISQWSPVRGVYRLAHLELCQQPG